MNQMQNKTEVTESIYDKLCSKKAKSSTLRFPIYLSDGIVKASIEELELSQRAYHCLKRRGFETIGSLVEHINGENDLLQIRNMGKLSAREVMKKLMEYQYSILSPERQKKFVERVVELNQ